eukprot:3527778-Pyramimonas_sp.AAC.1
MGPSGALHRTHLRDAGVAVRAACRGRGPDGRLALLLRPMGKGPLLRLSVAVWVGVRNGEALYDEAEGGLF